MGYCEPLSRSSFSLLQGASTPEELVEAAAVLGISTLGIADRDAVYGLVRAHKAAKRHGVHLLCGATLTLDAHPPVAVLAEDQQGWSNLCRLITKSQSDTEKGFASSTLTSLLDHNQGLYALIHYGWTVEHLEPLVESFGDRLGILMTRHRTTQDKERARWACALSSRFEVPLIASSDALMHAAERHRVADVLTCIRLGMSLDQAGHHLHSNAERTLFSEEEFRQRFSSYPQAIANGIALGERCSFSLDSLKYRYPHEVVPEEQTPLRWLASLVQKGLERRYPQGAPASVLHRVQHELSVIEKLDFAHYFLTVYDIVRFARKRGILCQGRGSAANSAVCYALGVTAVDPACASLLFERFISEERGEPPDIDVDFEHERREEVIQYIYQRYGRDRAALTNEFITYRFRSAVRDVGKVFGLSLDQVERLSKTVGSRGTSSNVTEEELVKEAGLDPTESRVRQTLEISRELKGLPRHLSIHVGGFVISDGPLIDLVPVEPARMNDRTVIQWDKDDIETLGFVKVDVLGLGMLTAIRKSFELIQQAGGPPLSLANVPMEDSAVYDMFCRADTMGVFQIESRAQMSMLPRLKPRCFYDLVIEVAIVRPGPIQGGMIHPYLKRRQGEEMISYPHPSLKPILERTLGVPLFQEQVMQMAVAVGGFTAGEADRLRRAMGAWRKRETLEGLGNKLVLAMQERGIPAEYADAIYRQIKGFGEYGFPESHAASFALLVYISGWLKRHYPGAFAASLINSQPMGFYSARSLLRDAERHGVLVRPISVLSSHWNCGLESEECADTQEIIRLGFRLIKGLGSRDAEKIIVARREEQFTSVIDFAERTNLDDDVLEHIAESNSFFELEPDRRRVLWYLKGRWSRLPLFRGLSRREPPLSLPLEEPMRRIQKDYKRTGLSVGTHPMQWVRPTLAPSVRPIDEIGTLKPGEMVMVAGMVINRQRPSTANGVTFMTLEDEGALINLIVWPKVWEDQRQLARRSVLLRIYGKLQIEGRAMSVVVKTFHSLDHLFPSLSVRSRDFH
jgi:error-prone DNA polymerase